MPEILMRANRSTFGRLGRLFPGILGAVLFWHAPTLLAQSGLAAAGFRPASGSRDLLAAHSPAGEKEPFSVSGGAAWAWRLLSLASGNASACSLKQRLLLFGGVNAWVSEHLRLGLYAEGAAWQQGTRTDAWGEPGPVPSGMGEAWLSTLALLLGEENVKLGMEFSLRLPSAEGAALAGEPSWGSSIGVLAEGKLRPTRLLLNAAVVDRRRTVYYDLERASTWQATVGLELVPESWRFTPAVEIFFERALSPRPGYRSAALQVLGGGFFLLGNFRISVGAAVSVLEVGSPSLVVVFRLGWNGGRKK